MRAAVVWLALACGCSRSQKRELPARLSKHTEAPATFAIAGDRAFDALVHRFYAGGGRWQVCVPAGCGATSQDWGADSLTYTLFLRWMATHDPAIPPLMAALADAGPSYASCDLPDCDQWSDVPEWDAVAAAREFEVTQDRHALDRAVAAFALVDRSDAFALGACPEIDYQAPGGGENQLKTLETDSNFVKAALLLHTATGDASYLEKARTKYAAVRRHFLDSELPLYSVYVFDDGTKCAQLPRRFFASVNGNMIWNGMRLAALTGKTDYRTEALDTARAVDRLLSDASGVYVDLQAENDIAEPLVEAMSDLATSAAQRFAREWILRNAASAASTSGWGRFFNGPAPLGQVTQWQANGGLALAIAAAAVDPSGAPGRDAWVGAAWVAKDISALPASLSFSGSGIALIGTIGEKCCEPGHARVFVDGVETLDRTGIWQNKSSSGRPLPDSILFAWTWPSAGPHTLRFEAGAPNAKEGGAFLHVRGYYLRPSPP